MRFLIDANMPRSTAARVKARGFEAIDVRDIGLGTSPDAPIARYARQHQLCIVTRDFDFGDIRRYPPNDYFGIVVLDLSMTAVAARILERLDAFIGGKHVETLSGRLAIVDASRVRWRK